MEGNIENESCSATWVDPKTVVEPFSDLQTSPLGPHKDKIHPKVKSIRIQGIIENESCSTTLVDPKLVFEPQIEPKITHYGPKKLKNNPKLSQKFF